MNWPQLREELDLFEGPRLGNGQPTWILHDPIRQQFFRIDWLTFEILKRWTLGDAQAIMDGIESDTALEASLEDLEKTSRFLADSQLLQTINGEAIDKLVQRKQAMRQQWWQWLVHHYLFFRIPLWRPDAWLAQSLRWTAPFFSKFFIKLSAAALCLGLYQLNRQWDSFKSYLLDTFTLEGFAAYAFALVASKFLHELGHAYALKRQGGRVPTMGIAFLVLWPMAYTDTNEAWKLADKKRRLRVSSAGIVTEALIAAWALLAWSLLPDGAVRSAMFFLAAVSLGLTLILNINPFMRFDGYFMLCDWLDMPNLHQRSFALAKWELREILFKLNDPRPEQFSRWKHRALVAFAWSTWIYRLILFLGIALMVYFLFTKLLGVILFIVEIVWFIWLPVRNELREWIKRRRDIFRSARFRLSSLFIALALFLFFIPLPTHITVSALLRPAETWPVHTPGPAVITALRVRHGDLVQAGQAMIDLSAPDVSLQSQMSQARMERLRWQSEAATKATQQGGGPLALLQTQLEEAQAQVAKDRKQLQQYSLKSPLAGQFILHDPDLAAGQWLEKSERLATVIGPGSWQLETWVNEQEAARVKLGDKATFFIDGLPRPLRATIRDIAKDATRSFSEGLLTAPHGGHILVREQQGLWVPEQANYRLSLSLDTEYVPRLLAIQRGSLALEGRAESLAGHYIRHALAVLIREFQP